MNCVVCADEIGCEFCPSTQVDGVGAQDEELAQEALVQMGVIEPMPPDVLRAIDAGVWEEA